MRQGRRVWHNIKPNETTRVPKKHIVIDTESRIDRTGKASIQTWRLAVASYITRKAGRKDRIESIDYNTPESLWEDVSNRCEKDGRTVLWAHNLGYDARIARIFENLPRLGWSLTAHNITSRGSWFEWKRDRSTLCMVDSTSVFPTPIGKLGPMFGMGKVSMDIESDSHDAWLVRCRRDVEILTKAVRYYLDWLSQGDMGNWQVTGASQSWATFRHKFLTHKMTVHDDEDALAAERRALWCGRCEAYWHGELTTEQVYEFDFKNAYPRIAKDYTVPTKLLGPMPYRYDWRSLLGREKSALLAEVTITTQEPVAPTSHNGRIVWPVGTFDTVLWDIEIQMALEVGAEVTVRRGWIYRKAPALKQWAEWILSELAKPDSECPAWRKTILKHWSRALIGRFAMTHQSWEEFAIAPDSKVLRGTVWDVDTDESYDIMQIGRDIFRDIGRVEWQNSMPSITGYIQAISRSHLWDILKSVPERTIIYADTDSVLCTERGLAALEKAASEYHLGELRLKRVWRGFAIYGPRQIVTGERVRVSGIPVASTRIDKRTFRGEVWDTLPGAMRNGKMGSVIVRDREWEINGKDTRRQSDGLGWTRPYRIEP